MNITELDNLIAAWLDSRLTDEERGRLEQLLLEDPAARRRLRQFANMDVAFRDLATAEVVGDVWHRKKRSTPTPEMPKADPPSIFPALWGSLPSALDWQTERGMFWGLSVVGTVAFLGALYLFVLSGKFGEQVAENDRPAAERPVAERPVAELGPIDRAVWADGGNGALSQGATFLVGDRIDLQSGLATIEFKDGAETIIEGPCQMTFLGPNAARLDRGKLAAKIEKPTAEGFTINTPFASVTDLGTEFGVAVDEETADVEVYQGEVVMAVGDSGGKRQSIRLGAGQWARVDRAGNVERDAAGALRLDVVRRQPPPAGPEPEDPVQARIITNFRNFSETGNLLGGSNSREQRFTARGASVTIAHAGGDDAGQELYLSDEFPTLAAGDRVSVDWVGTDSSVENEQWGLAITSGEVASGQNAIFLCWRSGGELNITVRNASSGGGERISGTTPDTLFIERTATGWTMGSITGGVETKHYEDISSLRGIDITADGSALGLFSDMRSTSNPKTLRNLTIRRQVAAKEARGDPGHEPRPK